MGPHQEHGRHDQPGPYRQLKVGPEVKPQDQYQRNDDLGHLQRRARAGVAVHHVGHPDLRRFDGGGREI